MSKTSNYLQRYEAKRPKEAMLKSPLEFSAPETNLNNHNDYFHDVVCKMTGRMETMEIKVLSLTSALKMLQKYTETKD